VIDYSKKVHEGLANAMKFRLDSRKWTPSNPRCLGFDATIKTGAAQSVKVGGRLNCVEGGGLPAGGDSLVFCPR
jgi:hypothetical protein